MDFTSPEHGCFSRTVKPRTVTPERSSLREHTNPEQSNWALSKQDSAKQDNMFDSVLSIDNTFNVRHTSLSRLSSLSEDISDSDLPENSVFDHNELDLVLETGFDLGLHQACDAPTFASIPFFQPPRTSTFAVKVWAAKRPLKPTNMFSNFYHARPINVGPLPHPTRYR